MPNRPNIVHLNPDQMRADCLGCQGHPLVQTPHLDRLAAQGTRFADCHVQHTVCTPSRCSFTTGWYPHVRGHRTLWHPLQPDEPNTLKYLKQAGYDVHMIGKNDLLAEDSFADSVTKVWDHRGQGRAVPLYEYGQPEYWTFLEGPYEGTPVDRVCYDLGLRFLRERRPDAERPFMLFLPTLWPHCAFTCPEPWYSMYRPEDVPPFRPRDLAGKPVFHRLIRQYRRLDQVPESVLRKLAAVYLGMISYVDHLVGELLDTLDATGLAANTAVFFFSDHGEWAGDYGLLEKWHAGVDSCLTRVPLIVRAPGGVAGHVVTEPVELFDIMPTTLELAGVPCTHTHFARSFTAQLGGAPGDPDRAVFTEGGYDSHEPHCCEGHADGFQDIGRNRQGKYYPKGLQQQEHPESSARCVSIRTRRHQLVRRPLDRSELYDLVADPGETVNLYDRPETAAVQAELERRLLDWYIHTSDVVPFHRHNRGYPPGLPQA